MIFTPLPADTPFRYEDPATVCSRCGGAFDSMDAPTAEVLMADSLFRYHWHCVGGAIRTRDEWRNEARYRKDITVNPTAA